MGRRPVTSTGVSVGPREYNVDHVLVLGVGAAKSKMGGGAYVPCGTTRRPTAIAALQGLPLTTRGSSVQAQDYLISPPDLILLFGDRQLFPSARRRRGRL